MQVSLESWSGKGPGDGCEGHLFGTEEEENE